MKKTYPLLKYFLWTIVLCLSLMKGQAQNNAKVDSLRSVLKSLEGVERVPALKALFLLIQYKEHQQAHRIADEMEKIGQVHQQDSVILDAWINKIFLYSWRSQYDSMEIFISRGTQLARQSKNQEKLGVFYNLTGVRYEKLSQLDSALFYYERAMATLKRTDLRILNNIAVIHRHKLDFVKSLEYFEQAMDFAQKNDLLNAQAIIANNIGPIYDQLGDTQKAVEYSLRSIQLKGQIGDERGKIFGYISLRGFDLPREQRKQYVETGLQIAETAKDSTFIIVMSVYLADIYLEEGKITKAADLAEWARQQLKPNPGREIYDVLHTLIDVHLAKNEIEEALRYTLQLKELAAKEETNEQLQLANKYLLTIYDTQKDFEKYHEIATVYYPGKDSLGNKETLNKLALLDKQLKDIEQEKEIELLNATLKQEATNRYWMGGLALLIGLILSLILYFRIRQVKTQKATIVKEQETAKKLESLNEKLKGIDEMKNRLYTNITHEFRTPLTIISGMTDQMVNAPDIWLEKGGQMVKQNTTNLLNLVNQMLELRKLESEELSVNMVQGNVVQYLRYLTESYQSYAQSKDLELHFLAAVKSIQMDYDPDKLLHIISNLLSNALKYTPAGGHIYLHIDRKTEDQQSFVYIRVEDTGVGIPKSELAHVFDRFYQVDDSMTRKGEGTGIGLALTKELVKLLNGQIGLSSELEKGTTFWVQLPITLEAKIQSADPSESTTKPLIPPTATTASNDLSPVPAETDETQPQLLIIEDNADVVQYLTATLRDSYQLEIARNGQEGIDKAIELVPDLIISDVMMPIKDGYEVCATLKEDERTSHIPIILLTAKADFDSKISGLEKGADAYLTKPFEPKELFVRLRQMFQLRKKLQARYAQFAQVNDVPEETATLEDIFLQKVRALVEKQLSDPDLSMPQISKALGRSRSQVYKKIKALTGSTPSQFIRSIRLHHAQKLLKTSDLNVSEVAYEVGFSSPSYFSNVFLEEFGTRPNDIRK